LFISQFSAYKTTVDYSSPRQEVVLPVSGRGFLVCDDQRREFQSKKVLEDLSTLLVYIFQQYIYISNNRQLLTLYNSTYGSPNQYVERGSGNTCEKLYVGILSTSYVLEGTVQLNFWRDLTTTK
jgi:hypothetical protein